MATTEIHQISLLFLAVAILLLAPSCIAWVGSNKDYDGSNPLYGYVEVSNEEERHDFSEEVESVPDSLLIFTALLRWFAPTDF